jgi:hypothetical protein
MDWKTFYNTNFGKLKKGFLKWGILRIQTFKNTWWLLIKTLLDRFLSGFTNSNFFLYFFVVIILVGSLGCSGLLYEYYYFKPNPNNIGEFKSLCLALAKSLSTYFIALIATSSADLILNRKPNSKEAAVLRLPALTMLILGGISIFLIQYNLLEDFNRTLKLAFYGTTLSLLFWWIANSIDDKYNPHEEKPASNEDNYNPLGGSDPNGGVIDNQIPANVIV